MYYHPEEGNDSIHGSVSTFAFSFIPPSLIKFPIHVILVVRFEDAALQAHLDATHASPIRKAGSIPLKLSTSFQSQATHARTE